MLPDTTPQSISYNNMKYSFTAIRRHLFKDKVYHVQVLDGFIAIGENFNDPKPKYVVEFALKNIIYWKMQLHQEKAFGIKYRKAIKYFEANQEQLVKFRSAIACRISFNTLDEHYRIDDQIGKGSFSSVYKIQRNSDNKVFAMKYVSSKQKNDKENMTLLENEINILNSLNYDAILKIYEVFKTDEHHYAIILEYIEGQCFAPVIEGLKKMTVKFKEQDIKIIMQQLLRALAYIHSHNIIHRDIKPQNIMFAGSDLKNIKLIDFGLSIRDSIQFNRCGTPGYMAPEIVNMKKDTQKPWCSICDVFSLGVVFYKLYQNRYTKDQVRDKVVFQDKHLNKYFQRTKNVRQTINTQCNCIHNTYSNKNLLKAMLARIPEDRINSFQALNHPFFSDLPPINLTDIPYNSFTSNVNHIMACETESKGICDQEISLEFPLSEEMQKIYIIQAKPSHLSRLQKTICWQVQKKEFNYKKLSKSLDK